MPRPLRALLPAVLVVALAGAGCGSARSEDSGPGDETAVSAPTATPTPDPAQEVDAIARRIGRDVSKRPRIPTPQGAPPSRLTARDIVRGKGRPARAGQEVRVQYVGAAWSDGQEFDASWSSGQAFTFPLGGGGVIQGWDRGVAGMRPGGRRLLVIPPELGYGATGNGPIRPNETLLFVVDLEAAR